MGKRMTLEETFREKREEAFRLRQAARILEREAADLKKEIAMKEFGSPGQEIIWTDYGCRHRGMIVRFEESVFSDRLICIVKSVGDGREFERHLSDGKCIVQRLKMA